MNIGRGYQGQTTLSDGQAFVLGGSWSGAMGGKLGEVWSSPAGWRELANVPADRIDTGDAQGVYRADNQGWFIATSGGKVFQAGPSAQMHWITTTGAGSITPAGAHGTAGDEMNGNAVLYDVGKILTVGGAPDYQNSNATQVANIVDISTGSAQVTSTSSMTYSRGFANSVALPDGHVFTVGGETFPVPFSDANSDLTPEMWDPATGQWTVMASQPEPRNYHSVAVLLPDGTVFSGGGGLCGTCATNHPDGQIFYPPYLFNADGSTRARPTISAAPSSAVTGQTISVTTGGPVQRFVLMRYGEATHTVDNDQRRIPLAIASSTGNSYRLTIPSDPGIALPGPYMLFAIDANGTPSVSATISISTPPASSPGNTYGTNVDASGPAVYWPLADAGGSGGAADLSGNRDTGSFSASGITYQTPSPVEGPAGQGVTLAGGQIVSAQPEPAPSVYSEEVWFKTTGSGGGALMRFGDSATGANAGTDRVVYMTSSGQLDFGVYTGVPNVIASPASYNDGSWHFAVATQGTDGMHLYVDGRQVAQNSVSSAQPYTGFWQLGGSVNPGWPSQPSTAFSGSISDAAMYLSELTSAQVQSQYVAASVSPGLTTTPSPTSVTLGPASKTLKDTATLSGGSSPTGSITFTLVYNGTTVDTETVAVSGNGSYSTPTGYTLPASGTVTGSYQWNATYSGDTNNNAISDNNNANERVAVGAASPGLSTIPNLTGSSSKTLTDTATLSGGSSTTGSITFTLVYSGTTVDTETVSVSGNGSYSTPTGYTLPSTGTVTGSYQWNAAYSGDANNNAISDNNNANERLTVGAASPALSTTPSPTSVTLGSSSQPLKDTATLSGGSSPAGSITFTLVYNGTTVDTETVAVSGNGSYSTPTGYTLPASGTVTGSYQWNAAYSGDPNNSSATETNNQNEQVTVSPASPRLSTSPSPASVTFGSTSTTLKDTATLSGGSSPTGSIMFTLVYNGTTVDTETVAVSGNGSYSTPAGYALPASGTVTGSYQWNAAYSGDADNDPVSESNQPSAQVVVSATRPTVSITSPAVGATYRLGQQVVSSFSCADGPGGPGLSACADQRSQPSGGKVDTSTPGPHTYTVTATSLDGEVGSASATYMVSTASSAAIPTTTAILAHSPDPSYVGQPVTVFYSVTATAGTPTGDVTVSDGSDSCRGTVAAGQCNIRLTNAGVHMLTATYGGDGTFSGGSSVEVQQIVKRVTKPLAHISGASETNRTFRGASKPHIAQSGRQSPPVGTTFTYKLDRPASVRFDFMQPGSGRIVDGKCVARSERNQRNRAFTSLAGSLSFAGHSGLNRVRFACWLSDSKKLPPGKYTLIITAITRDVGATSQRLTFTVLR